MGGPGNLISVRSDVAASLLIDGLHQEALRRIGEPLPAGVEELLGYAADPRAARLGYLARIIEVERFEPARAPIDWLAERLASEDAGAAALVSAALAEEEPADKPHPRDQAPSWRVPGPGGHVRHFLALRADESGAGGVQSKRSWLLGFFARCCEEAGPGPADPGTSI